MNSAYHDRFLNKIFTMSITRIILIVFLALSYASLANGEEPFFSIALSQFNNEQDAAKEETRLKNSGHNAFYRKEKSPDSKETIYQVYIEKYNSRDEAEKEAMVLNDLELISDYKVREVREIPRTAPDEKIPAEEDEPETLQKSQPPEIKEQAPVSTTGTEENATAPETNPAPEEQTAASETGSGTEEQTTAAEPSPVIDRQEKELPPTEDKTESKPEPKEKNEKPKPVINHDDARLTGASLQVGAFQDEANAASLKAKLRNMGKNAFYRHESADSKGDFYRLYITGYSSLREAIKDAKALLESGIISDYSRVHSKYPVSDLSSEESAEKEEKGKIYFIHISSNKDEANAAENVARLKEYGYKAFYVLEKEPSASWYRVYIGEFKDEAEAREKGMELLDQGLISYFKPIAVDRKNLDN